MWGVLFSTLASAQEVPVTPQSFPGLMNPGISANGLFLAGAEWEDGKLAPPSWTGEGSELPGKGETFGTGLSVQEMEVQLLSVVDPYFKANMVLAIPGTEGLEVEEGFVTVTSIPHVLLNIGKIKEPFGKENLTHTHALLTVDRALISQRVFGEEGLNDMGVNAQVMLPLPWFSELTVGVDAGSNDVALGAGTPGSLGYMAHWKNQLDVSDNYSLEIGISDLFGQNAAQGTSDVVGADLTLKGHGSGRHQWNRLVWQNEFLLLLQSDDQDVTEQVGGLYSTLAYSFTRRFWLGGRFDMVGLPQPVDGGETYGGTAIAAYAPTEFSSLRLQAQHQWLPGGHSADSITGQLNFVIGVHPAHSY